MIDTTTPNSPGWWLKRLALQLDENTRHADELDAYLRCENGIPITASKAVREAYRRLMRMARTNFAELLVEAVRERMEPVGFRTGADGDDLGDDLAADLADQRARRRLRSGARVDARPRRRVRDRRPGRS